MDFEIEYVNNKCICIKEFNDYELDINKVEKTSKLKRRYNIGDVCDFIDLTNYFKIEIGAYFYNTNILREYFLIKCKKNDMVISKTEFFIYFKVIHFVIPPKKKQKWYSVLRSTILNWLRLKFTNKQLILF